MREPRLKGATSVTVEVFIRDSTATDGSGKTGLAFNTSSLVASYSRTAGARVAITLVTQTTTGAWTSGGFVEIDATNMPGLYRLDIPDAAFASGADAVYVELKGATGMAQCVIGIPLVAVNPEDANYGLTNLDAAVSTRSTYAGGDTSGVTTLLTRISAAITITGGKVDIAAASIQAIWDALTSALTTSGSIGKWILDKLDVLVSSRSTYAGGAVASVTGAVGSVTGNVGGNVVGSVASVTAPVSITSSQLFIKKNVALNNFTFLMVDSSGVPATGLTVTAERSIDGGAFAACANSVTEISAGAYKINLANTDLNGVVVMLKFTATGAKARYLTIVTQA